MSFVIHILSIRQVIKQIGWLAWASGQAGSQAVRQTGNQAIRPAGRQVNRISFLSLIGFQLLFTSPFVKADNKLPWKTQRPAGQKVEALKNITVEENLGQMVDLNLPFVDEQGQKVILKDFFKPEKPVLLTLVYYTCPSLCNFHLNGVMEALKKMDLKSGQDFEFVAISFEPKDTPQTARSKKNEFKERFLKASGKQNLSQGWHFLTGTQENTRTLAHQLGFFYEWDERSSQWSHPAVAYVLTDQGMISRYLYGISISDKTLRLSLVEASHGKIGNILDRFILYCFNYNPQERKYSLMALNAVRAGAGITLILLGFLLIPFWIRNRNA